MDFVGGSLASSADDEPVEVDLSVLRGRIEGVMIQPLPGNTGRRVTFSLVPEEGQPADMRLFLTSDGVPLSETWSYVWYPERLD